VTLDASASAPNGCPVPLEYQFRDGATVLQPWSTIPTYGPIAPGASTTYTVDVRCTASPGCATSASQTFELVPFPGPSLGALAPVCAGSTVTLDAASSAPNGCPVPLEYQFRDGATILQPWSTTPTYGPIVPGASTTYTVDVRCTASPGCMTGASQPLTVVPVPTAVAGPDATVCFNDPLTLTGSGSAAPGCAGGPLYEWRRGITVVKPASPSPTYDPPTGALGTIVYTLVVACSSLPGCQASDDVSVTVKTCTMAVHFDAFDALRDPSAAEPRVTVTWLTSLEEGTNYFVVERAAAAGGPFAPVGLPVAARGPGFPYRFADPDASPGELPWYRVVEITSEGRGDETPAFRARADGAQPAASGAARGRGGARDPGRSR
jgi:hypothetical protein